jgi:hypothetical protein
MAVPDRVKRIMAREGLEGVNKPKRTPSHQTKSHVVMASEGGQYKLVRFGQQGAEPKPPRAGESKAAAAKRSSYFARHNAQDPNPSKLSARYWSHKKWRKGGL